MTKDRSSCYAELGAVKIEGRDYRARVTDLDTTAVILASHGGGIEPTTSEIAMAVAGTSYSLYLFERLSRKGGHVELHIRSERFDEPRGVVRVLKATTGVAIYGRADCEDPEAVWIGGLDDTLRCSADFILDYLSSSMRRRRQLIG